MRLIKDEATLRQYMPNAFVAVKGETPIFDKIDKALELAELWVRDTFTSETTFNTIIGYSDANSLKPLVSRLVVVSALIRAVPSLDMALTANGFAVVSTNTLAPASAPRVDRLMQELRVEQDLLIGMLLDNIYGASKWLTSTQAAYFGATLFPSLHSMSALVGKPGEQWQRYQELHAQVVDIEDSLADDYVSPELMARLRSNSLRRSVTEIEKPVVASLRAEVINYITTGNVAAERMQRVVNYIRQRPDEFPQWAESTTAQLFTPPLFVNTKKSTGYFF